MQIDVVLLPRELSPALLTGRAVVVFDVLRATTTMTAALAAGVKEIRIFGDLDSAMAAGRASKEPHLLCGEQHAVKPPGFDLGNSPGAFAQDIHRDTILFMSTTNGTKAILAAKGSAAMFTGALVNARAVARALADTALDVTLLCSGTEGFVCTEDTLGAGAVIWELANLAEVQLVSDIAWMARHLFESQRTRLEAALQASRGGHNVTRAGLAPDISFCSDLNSIDLVGVVRGAPPVVTRWNAKSAAGQRA